jgi:cytoskeletal protein RodZ
MSTILKALKKLEAQSTPSQADAPRPTRWQRKPSGPEGFSGFFSKVRILIALAAVAVLVLGGWIWWRNDLRPTTAFQEKPAAQVPPVDAPAPPSAPLTPRVTAQSVQKGPAANEPTATAPSMVTQINAPPEKKPSAALRAVRKPSGNPADAGNDRPSPPQTDGQQPRPASPMDRNRPGMTIQAIAWSIDPSNRIAVIDGSVVHEGDSLGEIQVSRIGKNHVVLSDGDHTWRVAFGKP